MKIPLFFIMCIPIRLKFVVFLVLLINIFPAVEIIFLKIEEVIFGFGFAFIVGFFGIAEQAPKAIHTASEDHGIFFRNDIVELDDIGIEVN